MPAMIRSVAINKIKLSELKSLLGAYTIRGPSVPDMMAVQPITALPVAIPTMPQPKPYITWAIPQTHPATIPGTRSKKETERKACSRWGTVTNAATQGNTMVDRIVKNNQTFSHAHLLA